MGWPAQVRWSSSSSIFINSEMTSWKLCSNDKQASLAFVSSWRMKSSTRLITIAKRNKAACLWKHLSNCYSIAHWSNLMSLSTVYMNLVPFWNEYWQIMTWMRTLSMKLMCGSIDDCLTWIAKKSLFYVCIFSKITTML